jgi:transposase
MHQDASSLPTIIWVMAPAVADAPKSMVVFESFGSDRYWVRGLMALGHNSGIIPAQYAKPFVNRQKTTGTMPTRS